MTSRVLPNERWDSWVDRVVLHVPRYFSFDGKTQTSGGRQRKVRDVANIVTHKWGRECVIVQKASEEFESIDEWGNRVIGIKAINGIAGDPAFGYRTSQLIRPNDGLIYVGGEDAWPFIVHGSKAYHVGVWWDGPTSRVVKAANAIRVRSLFKRTRSVICCDNNIINWVRVQGGNSYADANRAVYQPNAVDIRELPITERDSPGNPFRLLFARRYSEKRGAGLALDTVRILDAKGHHVRIVMSTAVGQSGLTEIKNEADKRGIGHLVDSVENDLDSVYSLYETADAALVPTLWSEGTSYSAVEAIAAGVPVVATTVGGLPNIIVPGFNGFVVSPNAEAFAEAIQKLMVNDVWSHMRQNGLAMRNALSKDTWNARVLEWLRN